MSTSNFTTKATEKFLLKAGSLGLSLEKVTELFDHVQLHPQEANVYCPIGESILKYISWNGFNVLYVEDQSQDEIWFVDIFEDRDPPPPPKKPSLIAKVARSFLRYEVMHELGKMIDRLVDHWPESEIDMEISCSIKEQIVGINKASTSAFLSEKLPYWNLDKEEFLSEHKTNKKISVIIKEGYEAGSQDDDFDKTFDKCTIDQVRASRLAASSSMRSLTIESNLQSPSWRRPSKLKKKNRTLYEKLWKTNPTSRNRKNLKIKERCRAERGATYFLEVVLFPRFCSTLQSIKNIHIESKELCTTDRKFPYLEGDLRFAEASNSKSLSLSVKDFYFGSSFKRLSSDNEIFDEAENGENFKIEQPCIDSSRFSRKYRTEARNANIGIPKAYSQKPKLLSWSEKIADQGGQHEYE
jgi:hypothetical protein